jgi:pimeloyl-ACP methyl ester carboxylesterase
MDTLLRTNAEVALPQGTVRYRDEGSGPTLVFIHGLLVNSALWRNVISLLSSQFRCIAPDLPLGAHSVPLHAGADLTPPGVAQLVADFIEVLDLQNVTLVGNDTGGAICQLVVTQHPERITCLVLTNCDSFEDFFPSLIRPFTYGARLFDIGFANFLAWMFRTHAAQRLLVALVSRRHADDALLDTYFTPLLTNKDVRRDMTQFLRSVSNRYTLEAARHFQAFEHPVLLVWGKNDLFFSLSNARRLQQAFPHARLELVAPSRAFVPEDQPEALAQKIAEFVGESSEFRASRGESSKSAPELVGGPAASASTTAEKE